MGKRIGCFFMSLLALIAGIAVQIVVGVLVGVGVGIIIGIQSMGQGPVDPSDIMARVNAPMLFCVHVLLILLGALWYRFGCGKPSLKKVDRQKLLNVKGIAMIFMLGVGLNLFFSFAMEVVMPIIPRTIMENYLNLMEMAMIGESALSTMAAVLLAPFGEELLFRGIAFYYTKKMAAGMTNEKLAFWIANAVQALWFGIFHMNIVQGTYAFVLGLFLGYVAHHFKSIIPAIAVHMIFNGFSSFVLSRLEIPAAYGYYVAGMLLGFVVVLGAFVMNRCGKKEAAMV